MSFAEWLSVTYGERGIGVSCLCPMGVNTAMYKSLISLKGRNAIVISPHPNATKCIGHTADILYKAARAATKLESFDFNEKQHPVMGAPTLNVGTIEGGNGVNMVPDSARLGVDIRTVPGQDHAKLLAKPCAQT